MANSKAGIKKELYADISSRVMMTLEHLAPKIEIYSIGVEFTLSQKAENRLLDIIIKEG